MGGNLGAQFHGTFRDVGDRVKSAVDANTGQNFARVNQPKDVAYSSTKESVAWEFADMAGSRHAEKHNRVPGRSRVYSLHEHPEQRPGEFNEAHPEFDKHTENLHEVVAPHFDVKERIDIRPGHQGTFPEINWNEHKRNPNASIRNPATHADALNHPTDDHIEYGHPGSQMNQNWLKNLGKQWAVKPRAVADPEQPAIPGLETWRVTGNAR